MGLKLPLAAALVILAWVALDGTAAGHSRPVRFDPAPGAVLNSAPAEIRGWFTSDIRRSDDSFVRVTDEAGNRVDTGETQLTADRRQMSVRLEPVPPGRYLVRWSTHDDADREVFGSCHYFYIGQEAADEAVREGKALDGGAECAGGAANGAPVESPAQLRLEAPESVAEGEELTITMVPTAFTARAPDGKTRDPQFGHYHIYLDMVPVDLLAGHSHDDGPHESHDAGMQHAATNSSNHKPGDEGLIENPVMWVENTYTFKELSAGKHTVTVALLFDDHSSPSPPVLASRSFRVRPDGGGLPFWALPVAIAATAVVAGAGAFALARRG